MRTAGLKPKYSMPVRRHSGALTAASYSAASGGTMAGGGKGSNVSSFGSSSGRLPRGGLHSSPGRSGCTGATNAGFFVIATVLAARTSIPSGQVPSGTAMWIDARGNAGPPTSAPTVQPSSSSIRPNGVSRTRRSSLPKHTRTCTAPSWR